MCNLPTIDDVMFFNNKTVVDENGNLTPIEQSKDVPFEIQRMV